MKYCVNLKRINVSSGNIKSLDGIENCTDLNFLNCRCNFIENIDAIKNLCNLRVLSLNHNKISSLIPISNLINIQELEVEENDLINLEGLENLENLVKFSCNENKSLISLKGMPSATKLTYLDCYSCIFNNFYGLHGCINLEVINAYWGDLTSFDGIENLTKLRSLSCFYNNSEISINSPISFNGLELDIRGTIVNNISNLKNVKINQ